MTCCTQNHSDRCGCERGGSSSEHGDTGRGPDGEADYLEARQRDLEEELADVTEAIKRRRPDED